MGNARFRPSDSTLAAPRHVFEGPWRNATERRTLRQARRSPLVHKNIAYSPLRTR